VKTKRTPARALVFAPLFIAVGCTLGPDHKRPDVVTAAMWKETEPAVATAPAAPLPAAWWQIFNDAELNALETQVITAHHDLQRG
jgi:outer membrane protein TolC